MQTIIKKLTNIQFHNNKFQIINLSSKKAKVIYDLISSEDLYRIYGVLQGQPYYFPKYIL